MKVALNLQASVDLSFQVWTACCMQRARDALSPAAASHVDVPLNRQC
jgi:hypothetical protein